MLMLTALLRVKLPAALAILPWTVRLHPVVFIPLPMAVRDSYHLHLHLTNLVTLTP
jgi:hypothetical protein